ncbi:hypothetical protein TNCV_3977631 [Trichonephila clavipes]|nr:hypothetical protein TNCV_3977631 [Trichonephila clavipes]
MFSCWDEDIDLEATLTAKERERFTRHANGVRKFFSSSKTRDRSCRDSRTSRTKRKELRWLLEVCDANARQSDLEQDQRKGLREQPHPLKYRIKIYVQCSGFQLLSSERLKR